MVEVVDGVFGVDDKSWGLVLNNMVGILRGSRPLPNGCIPFVYVHSLVLTLCLSYQLY